MTLDPDKIAAEMREAAGNATPGNWDVLTHAFGAAKYVSTGRVDICDQGMGVNAKHIAASNPANVLAILDERIALKADLAEAREAFTAIHMQGHAKGVDVGREERDALKTRIAELERMLGYFMFDQRFAVSVGGDPNVVEIMLASARAALSHKEATK